MRVIIRKANNFNYSGELGAANIPVNVDATGFSEKALDSPTMKNSILSIVKSNGWTATSVSVIKSSATGLFFISVIINATQNTTSELEKIKSGIGNILSSILPLQSLSANFAGAAAQTVSVNSNISMFSFQITSIGSDPLRDRHAKFNQLFVATFPKLLYTNPSTSYNDAGFASIEKFGGVSQISAVGESSMSAEVTKSTIKNLLIQSGINANVIGTVTFDQKTIQQLENGANLQPPKITSGGQDTNLIVPTKDWWKDFKLPNPDGNFLDVLALALGVTVPTVIVGGIVVLVLLKD